MCLRGSGTDIFSSDLLHPRSMNVFEWVGHRHFPLGPFHPRSMNVFPWVGHRHLPLGLFTEEGACVSVGRAHAPSTFAPL